MWRARDSARSWANILAVDGECSGPVEGRTRPASSGMAVLLGVFFEARMWGHMSTTDLPGSSLLAGRYRLVERLGAGGVSVGWRGVYEGLGRPGAVKVLPPSARVDPAFPRPLRGEAQAARPLSPPHIP